MQFTLGGLTLATNPDRLLIPLQAWGWVKGREKQKATPPRSNKVIKQTHLGHISLAFKDWEVANSLALPSSSRCPSVWEPTRAPCKLKDPSQELRQQQNRERMGSQVYFVHGPPLGQTDAQGEREGDSAGGGGGESGK